MDFKKEYFYLNSVKLIQTPKYQNYDTLTIH